MMNNKIAGRVIAVYTDQGVVVVKDDKKLLDWNVEVFDFEELEKIGVVPQTCWKGSRINVDFENGRLRNFALV